MDFEAEGSVAHIESKLQNSKNKKLKYLKWQQWERGGNTSTTQISCVRVELSFGDGGGGGGDSAKGHTGI